ncbi:MAG TPA: DUF1992 domain-containing protein [Propionibacterium sp.]|jgi:hypothetical protein|nr:DUF1992 domain-containing protein [Propionibacterium sp.]
MADEAPTEPTEEPGRPRRRGPRGYRVPVFEGWIDRQIREAIERGEFDNLPGAGKPIPNLDERDENWWIKGKLEREGIKPPLPNALALRREVEEIQRTLADVRSEAQAREIIDDLNERVRELYLHRDRGPLIVVRTVAVEPAIAEWKQRTNRS